MHVSGAALPRHAGQSRGQSSRVVFYSVYLYFLQHGTARALHFCFSLVTRHRGDSLTAINGTPIFDISRAGTGEGVEVDTPSEERSGGDGGGGGGGGGQGSGRRLNQESLRSLIVGPEGWGVVLHRF